MLISNIDSIFFSIDIEDYEEENLSLLKFLEKNKEKAKSNKLEDVMLTLNGRKFKILPNGARFHAYILHNDDLELKLAQNRSKNGNNYPVSIRIKSLYLWEKGFIDAYIAIKDYLKKVISGNFVAEKISRADICCHVDNLSFDMHDIYEGWRGNFRKVEYFMYNRRISGFSFGSFKEKNVMCRIYDKTLEIKSSGKAWFKEIWEKEGMNVDNIWNVEFQIGRKFFKDYEIEDVQDFILKMRSIWEYLTKKWICHINRDNENITRCSIKDTWKEVQKAYLDYCYTQLVKREKQLNYKADELIPLMVGVLTSYGACKQKIVLDRVIDDFKKDLEDYLRNKKENMPVEKLFFEKLEYMYG